MLRVIGLLTNREDNRVGPMNFEVESGEVFGILGPSGSGKTTVLRMIVRLERAEGRVLLNDDDVWEIPPHQMRRQIALVPQEPVLFDGSVFDNLLYGVRLAGGDLAKEKAVELLSLCGLEKDLLGSDAHKVSTGQKMRLCIARALANNPSVLMLDEPTAALDPSIGSQILRNVLNYARNRGIAVLLVSHRPQDVAAFARRALIIHKGRQIACGNVPDILHTPEADFLKHTSL